MAKNNKSLLLSMILGNNNRVSSKRVLGSFVIVVMTIMVVVCVFTQEDATWLSSAIDTLIITAGALLGLGIADSAFDKKQEDVNSKYNGGGNKPYQPRPKSKPTNKEESHCDEFNG
jgi:small neutral amino acid transporter SnatA (MarC family)